MFNKVSSNGIKKIVSFVLISLIFTINSASSYTKEEIDAADYLAYKWVISSKEMKDEYNLGNWITRREMLKVMINLSWMQVEEKCENTFNDLDSSDWGCKYAEFALNLNMIAKNDIFRPDDNVSKIEALKMIFKSIKLEREDNEDWKEAYVNTAFEEWIIKSSFTDYDSVAERWWIFIVSKEALLLWDDEDLDILNFFINN